MFLGNRASKKNIYFEKLFENPTVDIIKINKFFENVYFCSLMIYFTF